jgi:hypothetical protein
MSDLGRPSSYLLLQPGVPVYGADGDEVGTLAEVLAAPDQDIFDAIIVRSDDGNRMIPAAQVGEIYERGVELAVAAAVALSIPAR